MNFTETNPLADTPMSERESGGFRVNDRVESCVAGDAGTVASIDGEGRIRVEWDDRTNCSMAPRDLRHVFTAAQREAFAQAEADGFEADGAPFLTLNGFARRNYTVLGQRVPLWVAPGGATFSDDPFTVGA